MIEIEQRISASLFAVTVAMFAIPSFAQETDAVGQAVSTGAETRPGLTLATVEAGLAAIEADKGLKEDAKAPLRQKYKQAIEALREAADFASRASNYRESIKTAPEKAALLRAQQSRLVSESEMMEREQSSQSVREDLLQAQQDFLKAQIDNARAAPAALEAVADRRLATEAKRVGSLADRIPEDLPEGDEAVQTLATEVKGLAQEFDVVVQYLKQVETAQDELKSIIARLTERYDSVREELRVSAGGTGMAQILLDMQRRFRDQRAFAMRLTTELPPLDGMRLAALQIRKKLRGQRDLEAQFADHPSHAAATLVSTRREVLGALQTQYGNLVRALANLEGARQQYLNKAEEVRTYASEQLFGFGTRGVPPIGIETLNGIPNALRWFFRGENWSELVRALPSAAARMPLFTTIILVIVGMLLLTRRRIGAALQNSGAKVHRISTDRYAYTGAALVWTALLALPIPLLVGYFAWALEQTANASTWLRGITYGLQVTSWIILALAFLAALCRPGGLGTAHFRWQEEPLARFRQSIYWFAAVYIPALLITFGGVYEGGSDYMASLGRLSFALAHIWTAIVLWYLLNFSDGVLAAFIREKPASLIARWRYLWFPLALAYPLVLVIIAARGYVFTAIQLGMGLLETAAYVIGGAILYRLTRRWFRMKQRQLALAETLEKRRAQQEAAASQSSEESSDLIAVDPDADEALDLVSITEQTRDMLRLFFALGVAIAVLLAWSENFPVVTTFEAIPIPLTGGLTLLEGAQAVLILVFTYIATKNLPGLLELAVLRATDIEAGSRHAISTLSQYAVIAIGLSLFLNVLNVDWAKLGWIAAALSVGIGFGLQEVVANFVCGLILLFERPIRVGDVVTLDNTTGTVTKIRIRATTITNGDRQDFVVPNKRLITGSILNWTLTARLNRIIIRLGVACGTDPEKARKILLDAAADHPLILSDPAPAATFEQFGESSLNLALYAYLPDLANRTSTITDLHTEINKRFAAAGIEIPNPQYDLHIHSDAGGFGGAETSAV